MSPSGAAKPALLLEVAGDLEQKRGGRLIPPTAWLRVRKTRSEAFAGVTLACRGMKMLSEVPSGPGRRFG
jgi:hypothetical protein